MDKNKLIEGYKGGKAISALAREFGVSRQAIQGHLKRAGVTGEDKVAPKLHATPQKSGSVDNLSTVDIYAFAASLPKLEVYDNGAGSKCPVKGDRYYFEELDIWLPVVRDEGPLKDYVDYTPSGKRFKGGHPHHPDNTWKIDPTARHPYMV